jgi:hypothetical protein
MKEQVLLYPPFLNNLSSVLQHTTSDDQLFCFYLVGIKLEIEIVIFESVFGMDHG